MVLVHRGHVMSGVAVLRHAVLPGVGSQGRRVTAAEEKSEGTAGSRHDGDRKSARHRPRPPDSPAFKHRPREGRDVRKVPIGESM